MVKPVTWRDNVVLLAAWLRDHPGWSHRVDELARGGWEHVITAADGREWRHGDLGKLLDTLMAGERQAAS